MSKAEKFIQNYTRNCSNIIETINRDKNVAVVYQPWLTTEHARAVAQIAREEVIEKAVEWLTQWDKYRVCLEGRKDWFIEQFKKAMKEEPTE